MVNLVDLPPEILYNIISYLNILDSKGTPLLRYIQPSHDPADLGITFHKFNRDISLFDAMRVCRSWRNLISHQMFRQDVSMWSAERWREEIDRFRSVGRLVLIEMVRTFVIVWQKALLIIPVEERNATNGLDVSIPVEARRSEGEAEANGNVDLNEDGGYAQSHD